MLNDKENNNDKLIEWVPNKTIEESIVNVLLSTSLKTHQFTNYGPNVKLLEQEVRRLFKVEDAKAVVAVSNGSVAINILSIALELEDCRSNLKWATQSFTFPPSAQQNLKDASILDIDEEGGINLDEVDSSISGIIVTNIFGNVVNIEKYEEWRRKTNSYLIFDNAATPYTFYRGKNSINFGNGSIISFHHTKPFGFGEGGVIIVDRKYEHTIRCLINFGIGLTQSYFSEKGQNGKMSDISAIYILQYLQTKFDIIVEKHLEHFKTISKTIQKCNHIHLFPSFHDNIIVPSCFCILINGYKEQHEKIFTDNKICVRKYYYPLKNTPNCKKIYDSILCIPCTIDISPQDLEKICSIIVTIDNGIQSVINNTLN